jgi:TolA-binding protein
VTFGRISARTGRDLWRVGTFHDDPRTGADAIRFLDDPDLPMMRPSRRASATDRLPLHVVPRVVVVLLLVLGLVGAASPATAQRTTPRPADAFADAVALYERQMYGPAATAFGQFRQAHPRHVQAGEALFLEAKSMLALDRKDEATRLFQQLFDTYPAHPKAEEAQLQLAEQFLKDGNIDRARTQFRSVLTAVPNTPLAARALYQLGTAEQNADNLETALRQFQRVVREYGTSEQAPAALYAAAAIQVELERYEAAAASYEQLESDYADTAYARNVGTALGEVYYTLEQYEAAVDELRRRLSQLEGEPRARGLFFIAESLNQQHQYEAARARYQQLINEFPDSPYVPSAHYGTGWTYHEQQDYDAAAPAFSRSQSGAADSLAKEATYYEGVNLALSGDAEAARSRFRTVVETWPDSDLAIPAQYEVGILSYRLTDYGTAIEALGRYVDAHPSADRVGKALFWLGNAYLATDALDAAAQAYTDAETHGSVPDSVQVEVQFQRAWTLYQQDQHAEAAPLFRSIVEDRPSAPRHGDALFWAADSYYEMGERGRAQDLFQQYLNEHPEGDHAPAAQYSLAWTYFEQQNYRSAARSFSRFLRMARALDSEVPYRQDAQLRLADSHYALKEYGEAISAYRAVEGEGEDYALFQTGQALNVAGQTQRAIDTFQRLADRFSNSPWHADALYRMGFIHLQEQNYEAARAAYRRVIDQHPDSPLAPKAQYGLGDTYYNAGEMQAAQREYQTVLEQYPSSPLIDDAASSLFFALNARGADDRAQAVIDSFATENPDSEVVGALRFRRAEAAYQTGDLEKAQRLFQTFLRSSQNETLLPEAYYYLGVIYADRDRPREASTYLEQIVNQYTESPRRPEAALRLGDIHREQERYEAAAQAYQTAAETPGVDTELRAQARYGQSMALLQQGQSDAARTLLQQLVDSNDGGPLLASARLGLARIYEREGNTEDALSAYRTVVDQGRSETGAEALYRLGALLLESNRPEAAIRELERMPSLFAGYPSWIARSFLQQADAYQQLGQPGEAARLYDRVIQEHAGTRFAETAREAKNAL